MRKTIGMTESSVLYRKIDELGLSGPDRTEAIAALQTADRLANAIYWVFEKFVRGAAWMTPGASFKHQ
jgi:hypothetical protein